MIGEAARLFAALLGTEVAVALPRLGPMLCEEERAFVDLFLQMVPPGDLGAFVAGFEARHAVMRAWSEFQTTWPLVLGPVSCLPPFRVGDDLSSVDAVGELLHALRLVTAVSTLGLPAAVVAAAIAGDLPVGVQLIGARYGEDLCLDAAEPVEQRLGVLTPIDPRPEREGDPVRTQEVQAHVAPADPAARPARRRADPHRDRLRRPCAQSPRHPGMEMQANLFRAAGALICLGRWLHRA